MIENTKHGLSVFRELHPTKNIGLTPEQLTRGSKRKVWWKCSKAAGHVWEATIASRMTRATGCPYCAGKRASEENNLLSKRPDLVKEWHPEKNAPLTARDVTLFSSKKVWWKCSKAEGHDWQATIASRAARATGCPYCAGRALSETNNLEFKRPDLAKEWHPLKNGSLKPKDVVIGSSKRFWWKCSKGEDHEWQATLVTRVRGAGCPFCAGKISSKQNNLAQKQPALALQWHVSKNGDLTPSKVTEGSNRKVWWRCSIGHEWQAIIKNRVRGSGCPLCRK